MVEFPDNPKTMGEKYRPAMEVKTKKEAAAYFEACVQHHIQVTGSTREEAEAIQRHNIGYIAGYYDTKKRQRIWRLYGFGRPVFGVA
jgi:hypothetical protein